MAVNKDPIIIPDICKKHQHQLIVWDLKIMPDGPWMSAVVVANILLFQGLMFERIVNKPKEITVLGCLGCKAPNVWDKMVKVMKKGFSHAAQVSQMKIEDPDWYPLPSPPNAGT